MAEKKKLPVIDRTAGKPASGGRAAFTDGGTVPAWVSAARAVMVVAFAATLPTIIGIRHGNRLTWTVLIAILPFFWMTFGFHLWRRICPLAVMGQIGRLVGRPGTKKLGEWFNRNYFLVQLGVMLIALTLRLVATNGSPTWLAAFLGAVILAAVITSFVYAGKTWCNFFCPVGMVEKFYTEPSGAATGPGALTSQCAPCVACKKHCPDIDLEQGYWKEATERPRRIAYFAWPGIVVGFYTYYFLVAGSWDYYFGGGWTYERDLPSKMFGPGFTFAPAIPRVLAAPLTLLAFGFASYLVATGIEKLALARRMRTLPAGASDDDKDGIRLRVRHGMLAACGLVGFNAFYLFAGQPTLRALPGWVVTGWNVIVVFASTAMFVRRFTRREDQYIHEKFAQKILKKWEWGDAPPSDKLEDIYLLHTERTKQREARLRAYKETVREMVADGIVTKAELAILDQLRAQLGIQDKDHQKVISELSAEERQLFDPAYRGSQETRLAREAYRKDLTRIVVEAARAGVAPSPGSLEALREERGVTVEEETVELAQLLAPGGPIAALFETELVAIEKLVAAGEAANHAGGAGSDSASLSLVRHLAKLRAHAHAGQARAVLSVMTNRLEVDAELRGRLAALMQRLESAREGELVAEPILAVSSDPSKHLRAAAAMMLSRFDGDAPRARMVAMLDDPEPIVREAAVRAIGSKSRLTRDILTKVLDDPDPIVRHAAVRAVSGVTSGEVPITNLSAMAQTKGGVGKSGVYATLDANAAMASLTTIEKMMLLRQVPMFGALGAEDLEELATIVDERRVDPGLLLFAEGEPGDAVYLVVKGSVCVFQGGLADRPERVLSELGAGQCIGEMAVLDSAPRSASVRALERTRFLRVPGEEFKRVMSERPEMSQAIVAELVKRMRGMLARSGPAA